MATQFYMSSNDGDSITHDPDHAGTSSTATDLVELRIGDGTTVPTQRQVLNIMEQFQRWIIQNGRDGVDADGVLPPNRG